MVPFKRQRQTEAEAIERETERESLLPLRLVGAGPNLLVVLVHTVSGVESGPQRPPPVGAHAGLWLAHPAITNINKKYSLYNIV